MKVASAVPGLSLSKARRVFRQQNPKPASDGGLHRSAPRLL